MAKTDDEVVDDLRAIYREEFGGKLNQRFLISWSDLRAIYGFQKLFESRVASLAEVAAGRGLYVMDLGQGDAGHHIAIVKIATLDRWRKVPRRVVDQYRAPQDDEDGGGEDEGE